MPSAQAGSSRNIWMHGHASLDRDRHHLDLLPRFVILVDLDVLDVMNDIEPSRSSTKYRMLVVQPCTRDCSDEELAAIRAGSWSRRCELRLSRTCSQKSPALAMASMYGRSNLAFGESSSSKLPPQISSPPVPSPAERSARRSHMERASHTQRISCLQHLHCDQHPLGDQ